MARQAVVEIHRPDVVVGVDGGLASVGIAVVSGLARGSREAVIRSACVQRLEYASTKKIEKKLRTKVRASTDDRSRIEDLTDTLTRVVRECPAPPVALAIEWYVPNPKQRGFASGAWKTAIMVGAALGVARGLGIAALDQLPGDVKQLVGSASASKDDVEAWLAEHVPGFSTQIQRFARTNREHPSDAAAHAVLGLVELAERRRAAGL